MTRTLLALAALVAASSSAFALTDAEFAQSMQPVFHAAADGRYKIVERKSKEALNLLKDLREYADNVKDRSEKLRKEMLDNHYEDWVNTRLSQSVMEAKALQETVKKTHDLEKSNVSNGLNAAKKGDYGPIDETLARINAFEADYEARVNKVDAAVAAVREAFERHFGDAKAALAQFNALPLVKELLGAKPQLVKNITLTPVSLRPIKWAIRLEKKQRDSNDPRFGQLPRSISTADASYSVIIR